MGDIANTFRSIKVWLPIGSNTHPQQEMIQSSTHTHTHSQLSNSDHHSQIDIANVFGVYASVYHHVVRLFGKTVVSQY